MEGVQMGKQLVTREDVRAAISEELGPLGVDVSGKNIDRMSRFLKKSAGLVVARAN
jgi:hypothetical protein